jgi:hypothetical protein
LKIFHGPLLPGIHLKYIKTSSKNTGGRGGILPSAAE